MAIGAAGTIGPADGAASRGRCHPHRSATLLEDRRVVVYELRTRFGVDQYACAKPSGRTLGLVQSDELGRDYGFHPPAVALASRAVAWASDVRNDDGGFSSGGRETLVSSARFYPPGTSRRHRGWFVWHVVHAGSRARSRVGSVAVRPTGSLAWIVCPPRRHGVWTCRRSGHRDHVYVLGHSARRRVQLAVGRDIDPRSLRRRGHRVVWMQGGRRRSANFPS